MSMESIIEVLLRYNVNAPRYTSYPPANFFDEVKEDTPIESIWRDSNALFPEALSFYFHVPFCNKRCYFCGCTSENLKEESYVEAYFAALYSEMDKKLEWISKERKVHQIHFGGGTPTSVPTVYLKSVIDRLKEQFEFTDFVEVAIECNPATVTEELLLELREAGFNRVSYGIQDFNLKVLKKIGREPSLLPVPYLVDFSKKIGFKSVNLDLIYGLPGQNQEVFLDSVHKTIEANPERVALFSYAHVPWVRPEQKVLDSYVIPSARDKMRFFLNARAIFMEAGYLEVGMDHFVKPSDSLGIAAKTGSLHRNFQGYCTRETTGQVYAFGSSAISQLDNAYLQNTKNTSEYIRTVRLGLKTEIKVHELSVTEKMYRDMIERLMCNHSLKVSAKEKKLLGNKWGVLCALAKDELVEVLSDHEIVATELGRLVIRFVASKMDPLLDSGANNEGVFSKTI